MPPLPSPSPSLSPTDIASESYDDLILGAGMAGLTVGSLLAAARRRVLIVEAHDTPGGYAHTFQTGQYRFCAQVHYIFSCGEGEPVHELLRRLGLDEEVLFQRLDPEGFDHIVVGGERYRIPNGLEKLRDRLIRRFPDDARPIRGYIDTISALGRELDRLPKPIGWRDLLMAPLRFPHLLKYRRSTLQQLFDELRMPARLQTIFAGQAGDYLLGPADVSLLLHVALVRGYDRGAYYPRKHFQHFIGKVAESVSQRPGCRLLLETEVDKILVDKDRVTGVRTRNGQTLTAGRYISNIDPRRTAALIGEASLPRDYLGKLSYEYSLGTVTIYLGVRGLDLRRHGFGSFNVWHYPHDDINGMYRRQDAGDLGNPWLFMSTPTLHSDEPGLCPPGDQILEIATNAPFAALKQLRDSDRKKYNQRKKEIRDRILGVVEERYVPNLSKHLALRVTGTPATNERFCGAPEGNAYGAALTPANVSGQRVPFETPLANLWMVNATAGYPSIGGTVSAGLQLYERLAKG